MPKLRIGQGRVRVRGHIERRFDDAMADSIMLELPRKTDG